MNHTLQRYSLQLRAEMDGGAIVGHASVFDQVARVPGGWEAIAPTAFRSALADPTTDVRALRDHNPSMVLGRQGSGTLQLATDAEGLAFRVELPDTSYANDLRALVARGDVTGASFGFIPDQVESSRAPDGQLLRTHTSVGRLVDVSVVTFPAYEGAGVALRSVDWSRSTSNRSRLVRARALRTLSQGRNHR